MQRFPGQAKDEKILFFAREHWIEAIRSNRVGFNLILFLIIWIVLLDLIFPDYMRAINLVGILLIVAVGLYILMRHHNTFLIITNKRVLKQVKTAIFSIHKKEIRLDQIVQAVYSKKWIWENLLKFGSIKIVATAKEATLWFRWISLPDEVVAYISRLRDFLAQNPDVNISQIRPFITRRQRYKNKA